MNFVEEIIKNTKENELRVHLEKISKASLEGRTDCFLTCSEGLMTKDTMQKIVNEYGYDLIITYHDIITTFIKCYFGDIASGTLPLNIPGKMKLESISMIFTATQRNTSGTMSRHKIKI